MNIFFTPEQEEQQRLQGIVDGTTKSSLTRGDRAKDGFLDIIDPLKLVDREQDKILENYEKLLIGNFKLVPFEVDQCVRDQIRVGA